MENKTKHLFFCFFIVHLEPVDIFKGNSMKCSQKIIREEININIAKFPKNWFLRLQEFPSASLVRAPCLAPCQGYVTYGFLHQGHNTSNVCMLRTAFRFLYPHAMAMRKLSSPHGCFVWWKRYRNTSSVRLCT